VVFWLQTKYTPKPPATTPEQEQQQKMMQWMTLIFPVFLYNGPAGLNLYILTSTTIGIIESKIIRKHIKEKEERRGRRRGGDRHSRRQGQGGKNDPPPEGWRAPRGTEEAAPSGIGGWFASCRSGRRNYAARRRRSGSEPDALRSLSRLRRERLGEGDFELRTVMRLQGSTSRGC
jgi:hypothetical protein